ncbi:putative Hemolysin-type calcium-binding region [uncultured Pleomorphomonas sp.]|uniref:Putative Hemolysin-type calcium-binding region n=2 Tax=uncultured Pleomorphomonas sp. TaxID=442121 RepID=A0A212LND8_9HYPH|nr:putative Hemolysin-type calcium-binding region [uncultured Pleomorphomonas sp.]
MAYKDMTQAEKEAVWSAIGASTQAYWEKAVLALENAEANASTNLALKESIALTKVSLSAVSAQWGILFNTISALSIEQNERPPEWNALRTTIRAAAQVGLGYYLATAVGAVATLAAPEIVVLVMGSALLSVFLDNGITDLLDVFESELGISIRDYSLDPTEFIDSGDHQLFIGNDSGFTVSMTASADVLGGTGNDTITGSDYADNLQGWSGDDTINGKIGADVIWGDGGKDTLDGGEGGDEIHGGTEDDTIKGGGGNDTIWGDGGDDTIVGNGSGQNFEADNDTIHGGLGDDVIYGGAGSDTIYGDAGNDEIYADGMNEGASTDVDTMYGGEGADTIFASGGTASIFGGSGADVITITEYTKSTIDAGSGDDKVFGGTGQDQINGGSGGDILFGGEGADTILGGDGDDVLIGGNPSSQNDNGALSNASETWNDNYRDVLQGGTGYDVYQLYGSFGSQAAALAQGDFFSDSDGQFTVAFSTEVPEYGFAQFVFSGDYLKFKIQEFFDHPEDDDIMLVGGEIHANYTFIEGFGESFVFYWSTEAQPQVYFGTLFNARALLGAPETPADPNNINGSDQADDVPGTEGQDNISGGNGDDQLSGSGDDDNISGGAGNDHLAGGDDNDILSGGEGDDTIDGGEGKDTAKYSGDIESFDFSALPVGPNGGSWRLVVVDRSGHEGSDTLSGIENVAFSTEVGEIILDTEKLASLSSLVGSEADDQLTSAGGASILRGLAGNDTLIAGSNGDLLFGGDGNDTLISGLGDDLLFGGKDEDRVDFSAASQRVEVNLTAGTAVGFGSDKLFGIEDVTGTAYDDQITGNASSNRLVGGGGGDTVSGEDGDDYMDGGDGFDILYGGSGSDEIHGGGDLDYIYGGSGDDRLYGDGADDVLVAGEGDDYVEGGESNDNIDGESGDDKLFGGAGSDLINGGAGDDVLDGGDGTDRVTYYIYDNIYSSLTDRFDIISSSDGTVFVTDRMGVLGQDTLRSVERIYIDDWSKNTTILTSTVAVVNQTIWGTDADDSLVGSNEVDIIVGGLGNDYLSGGVGDDRLFGGAGDDTIDADAGDDIIVGGAGLSDWVSYWAASNAINVDLGQYKATGFGNDVLLGIENVWGSDFDDQIVGDDNANGLYGSVGDDALQGAAGDDNLDGGAGDDILAGGDGDDHLYGGDGDDTIDGGEGTNDWVTYWDATGVTVNLEDGTATGQGTDTISNIENVWGSVGDDSLTGNGQDNGLYGSDGNDFIWGVSGYNTLDGGAGDDDIVSGHGNDAIEGGEGTDTVEYWWSTAGVTVSLAEGTAYGDGDDTLSGIENVVGSSFDDTLTGDAADNQLYGDTGDDVLNGLAGNDYLNASDGDDVLNGGAGDDYLVGGEGADAFRFDPGFGHDAIEDFSLGDVIEFASSLFADFDAVLGAATEADGSTLIALDEDNSVTLQNVALASLTADEFRFAA